MATVTEAMTTAGMPLAGDWTVDDLDRLPDDGLRYELVDGVLLVSSAPITLHALAVQRLGEVLSAAAPGDLQVLASPVGFMPSRRRELQPDIVVVELADIGGAKLTQPPRLVVEVLSPSTQLIDRTVKRAVYEQAGVPAYWLVDVAVPSLIVLEFRADGYQEVARVTGDQRYVAARPYPVTVVPAALVRR